MLPTPSRQKPPATITIRTQEAGSRTPSTAPAQTQSDAVRFLAQTVAWYVAQPVAKRESAAERLSTRPDGKESLTAFGRAVKPEWRSFSFADGKYRILATSGDADKPSGVMVEVAGTATTTSGRARDVFGGTIYYANGKWSLGHLQRAPEASRHDSTSNAKKSTQKATSTAQAGTLDAPWGSLQERS